MEEDEEVPDYGGKVTRENVKIVRLRPTTRPIGPTFNAATTTANRSALWRDAPCPRGQRSGSTSGCFSPPPVRVPLLLFVILLLLFVTLLGMVFFGSINMLFL